MIAYAVASVLAAQLAAGALIDGAASAEVRAAGIQQADQVDVFAPLQAVPALQLAPSVRAAVESGADAASVSYGLQLAGIPAPATLTLYHRGQAGFELAWSPLLRTRGTLSVEGGELDPLQAQLTLIDTGRVDAGTATLPYLAAAAELAAELRLSPRARLEAGITAGVTGITDVTQAMRTGSLHAATLGALTRHDEGRLQVAAHMTQAGAPDGVNFDAAPGLSATAGLRHLLLRGTGVDLELGAMALALMRAGDVDATVVRPLGMVRAFTLTGLGGERALAGNAELGFDVTPNPGGAIAESRLRAALAVEARLATGIAVALAASGFAPQRVLGGAPLEVVPSGQAAARGAWSLNDRIRLDAALTLTARVPSTGVALESVIATIGVSGTTEIWHSGGRPRGTDTRAGAALGVAPVGAAPAPGTTSRPPPEPPQTIAAPPPPPPALIPPQVQSPAAPPPPAPPVRLPRAKPKPRPTLLNGDPVPGDPLAPAPVPGLEPARDGADAPDEDEDDGDPPQ